MPLLNDVKALVYAGWEVGGGRWLLNACPCWVQPTMGVAGISSGNSRGGAEQVRTGARSG